MPYWKPNELKQSITNSFARSRKTHIDLVTEKTLKNPFLLGSINSHKVQLLVLSYATIFMSFAAILSLVRVW